MLRLYDYYDSGNGYKVRLLLAQLGIRYEYVETDILKGETRTPEFLALHPNGRVPLVVLEDGTALAESNAILFYLAEGTLYLPADKLERARVLQWLFFEQYSHEPYVAVARFIQLYQGMPEDRLEEYKVCQVRGNKALKVMEKQLQRTPYLVGDQYSIADIALYAYTHVAEEADYDLGRYPAIRDWLARVAERPRHVGLDWRP